MSQFPQPITEADHIEPVPRRVRAALGGEMVLDTTRALYVWEWPYYPQFHVPAADVRRESLVEDEVAHGLRRGNRGQRRATVR